MAEQPKSRATGWALIVLASFTFMFFTAVAMIYGIPFWAWATGAVLSSPIWGGLSLWGMAIMAPKEGAAKVS